MDYSRPHLADRLAADYVLGTLRGPALRRFEALLPAHPALRQSVQGWQERLSVLAMDVPPVPPSPQVWMAIQRRLFPDADTQAQGPTRRWWQALGLWQGWAGVATVAAIAGENAGHVYGLKVVAGPIEDRPDNTTRFLVLGRELLPPCGHDRTSLMVFVRDQPGALYNVLSPFARHGVSMNRIESRPAHTGSWQYAFFIDVDGHAQDGPVAAALAELGEFAADIRILGAYPVALL